MRLPPKKDPRTGSKWSSVQLTDVLKVLYDEKVSLDHNETPGFVVLQAGDVVDVQSFTDPVDGEVIRHLCRIFGVDIMKFYHVNKQVH